MTREEMLRLSLDGLSVGDAFGEQFMNGLRERLANRVLPDAPWRTTDDTEMACEIAAQLLERGAIDQDDLALRFARRHAKDPNRGYGGGAHRILASISAGASWRVVSKSAFKGEGSIGNGGAMRVAPLGAFFSDDLARVVSEARASAEVTHAHPEGQAGAIAVAVAAAWSARGAKSDLFDFVLPHVPAGPTRGGIERAAKAASPDGLGNGSRVISEDTVPFCLWSAARNIGNYEAALWSTASQLGDIDTNCAIVGGIVCLRSPIPAAWLAAREKLH
jgi:ADP-ribosylglycohydrolase